MAAPKLSKAALSATMLAMIAIGAKAPELMSQLQKEQEGTRLVAYQDGSNYWTICGGLRFVDGKEVKRGMRLTQERCDQLDAIEQQKALDWVDANIKIPLSEPQKTGIASFCPWNIGPQKCFPSGFYLKINRGDVLGACAEIQRWIKDKGRDCRIRSNGCYGQVSRRDRESALTCWGLF